jgi:ribosome-binding protein aMBF1 (putative translation factor)
MKGGVVIREARRRARISQRELAQRLGTKQSVIARWESQATSPSFEAVMVACRACDFELDWRLRPADPDEERLIRQQRARGPADRVAGIVNLVALRHARD